MSTIQIINTSDTTHASGNRSYIVEAMSGKHSATVLIDAYGVRVIVHNSSNRTWRRLGKHYRTAADAVSAYKTAAIREIIETAVELHAGNLA